MLLTGTLVVSGGAGNMSMSLGDASMQSSETSRYLFINKAGEIVVNAIGYESVGNFSEGLAAVFDPGKGWGFIDKTGALVIKPRFGSALNFREGLAPVLLAGKWGFINKTGDLVIENPKGLDRMWPNHLCPKQLLRALRFQPTANHQQPMVSFWLLTRAVKLS
jgi:hypothetical protein